MVKHNLFIYFDFFSLESNTLFGLLDSELYKDEPLLDEFLEMNFITFWKPHFMISKFKPLYWIPFLIIENMNPLLNPNGFFCL
jgi:hypothetical protein